MAIPLRGNERDIGQARPRVIPLATINRPVGHRNRYRIRSLLSVSRSGQVWMGTDTLLGQPVAIKMLRRGPSRSPEHRERFRRELRTMGRLSHPHLLPVLDGDAAGDRPFLVTPLMERTLADAISSGPLDAGAAAGLGTQLASGLAHLHSEGFVHRDIKPANLLLDGDALRIGDFGIIRDLSDERTPRTIGSIHYMSPDRVQERPATTADDVYSVGVVLFEMVVGQPPYLGRRPVDVARQHVSGLQGVHPPLEAAGHLGALIRATLALDGASRPTAAELAADLRSLCSPIDLGSPIDLAG